MIQCWNREKEVKERNIIVWDCLQQAWKSESLQNTSYDSITCLFLQSERNLAASKVLEAC